ncbi:hypothetical protein QJS10_CPB18g01722 [Acorus calamus]|uniref:PLATZ transcription factor family protein n=1 Tax=Acorus calamus TaxID=4465 RepID=A0AAV9CQ17_ACOCL|nr:hypothetical protein QJS10_CPB18g01722 [Acorus calamus]
MEAMLVPPWLEPLLTSTFFTACDVHGESTRSECNMYCMDCAGDPFCYYCRSTRHSDHRVIQIRRSSYHDVVRVSEVEKELDISEVQTYVINSARVMFLNERPQPRSSKGATHICEICGRSLLDTFRFCSLGCKLVGIKRNGDACFVLDSKVERDIGGGGVSRRREELREGIVKDIYPSTPPPTSNNSRRRKVEEVGELHVEGWLVLLLEAIKGT